MSHIGPACPNTSILFVRTSSYWLIVNLPHIQIPDLILPLTLSLAGPEPEKPG